MSQRSPTVTAATALNLANIFLALLAAGLPLAALVAWLLMPPELDPQLAARYREEARQRLTQHADEIQQEVADVASETLPPIATAVYEQIQEDYDLYLQVLREEGDLYLGNLEQIFVRQVQDQYGEYLRRHRDVLKQEFPQYANDEHVAAVLADFELTFDRLVERYYLEEFRRETDRTLALWRRFEPAPSPKPGEPSLQEQLADYAADWVVLSAADASAAAGAAPPPATAP